MRVGGRFSHVCWHEILTSQFRNGISPERIKLQSPAKAQIESISSSLRICICRSFSFGLRGNKTNGKKDEIYFRHCYQTSLIMPNVRCVPRHHDTRTIICFSAHLHHRGTAISLTSAAALCLCERVCGCVFVSFSRHEIKPIKCRPVFCSTFIPKKRYWVRALFLNQFIGCRYQYLIFFTALFFFLVNFASMSGWL